MNIAANASDAALPRLYRDADYQVEEFYAEVSAIEPEVLRQIELTGMVGLDCLLLEA